MKRERKKPQSEMRKRAIRRETRLANKTEKNTIFRSSILETDRELNCWLGIFLNNRERP